MRRRNLILMCASIAARTILAGGLDRQAVIEAVSNGNMTAVSNYLAQGGDVNLRDDHALGKNTLLMYAVAAQKPEMCDLLLQKGARISDSSFAGLTALSMAELKYSVSQPRFHEERIAEAEKRLETAGEKYREVTRKRIEFYRKQYKDSDTSNEAQQRAKRIVDMLKGNGGQGRLSTKDKHGSGL